jgi:outer membrane lipoprotein-sorting protein
MRTCSFAVLGIAGLFTANAVKAADDAAAIVAKAIKAQGDAATLAKIKAEQWTGKGKLYAMGLTIEYTANYSFEQPDKLRFDFEAMFGDQKVAMTAACDGKTCWEKSGDKAQEMDKKKAGAFRHNVYIMSLTHLRPLKEKGYTLSVSGEEKINGKPAVSVLVSSKGHPDVTLFFDKKSGLVVKSMSEIWDEFADMDVAQETIFSDYKEKDGRKLFGKLVIKRGGKTFIEEEFSDQKGMEKLDPKLFEKP